MCGITGFVDLARQTEQGVLHSIIETMTATLSHRGPDDEGVWVDEKPSVALGHRRLAIVDLSRKGHQPMHSACGRYVISYNGEIYNFGELRQTLETLNHNFQSYSDTEVLLSAITEWGLQSAIERFVGMFAFALWDRDERKLYLVRDRLGIKPLYYGWAGRTFLFGSELKALCAYPHFMREVNRNALSLYLRHGYIPAPYSIYRDSHKVPAGSILTLSSDGSTTLTAYWSLKQQVEIGMANPFDGSADEAITQLDTFLRNAVKLRMIADVPMGAFLSGGIDSSSVVALMQTQNNRPVKTFSIGFYEDSYNEAKYARLVADHLGTEHTELYVTPEQALTVIPRLPTLYDEPFADLSQIPTFLISELARQSVTVALSGDGGDELFGGYDWYFRGQSSWRKLEGIPNWLSQASAYMLETLPPPGWEKIFKVLELALPHTIKPHNLNGEKPYHLAQVLRVKSPEMFHLWLISHWKHPDTVVIDGNEPLTSMTHTDQWVDLPEPIERMMYLDTAQGLTDDILTKVDRASMGVSLEARVPLLDHRVVEFAWRLPLSMKIRNGQGKWLLRQVLYRYVPKPLIERPKQGFTLPVASWLRGPLRDWAESLLDERRLQAEGFFNPQPIRQKWREHLSGQRNWYYYLWDVLMFQAWQEEWVYCKETN
jgi:asparagine synthase (glutamine-hydrolysing)